MSRYVVFTDLDGTLLDRNTYSWAAAATAIDRLKSENIPILFCSSKTLSEQKLIQRQLGIHHPLIVENGSAIVIPQGYFARNELPTHQSLNGELVIKLGCDSDTIRTKLQRIQKQSSLDFRGYAQMTDREIGSATGLRGEAIRRARQRDYSETISIGFSEADWLTFDQALKAEGLNGVSGGKLFTVTASGANKGRAVRLLIDLFKKSHAIITTVGLGDSPNDRDMLAQMDIAFQVQRPDGTWHDMQISDIRRVGIGPLGWQQAISSLMPGAAK